MKVSSAFAALLAELQQSQESQGFLRSECIRFFPATPTHTAAAFPLLPFFTLSAPRSPILLCHGLNMRPSALDPLAGALVQEGFAVLRMSLSGHNAGGLSQRGNPLPRWQTDVQNACELLQLVSSLPPLLVAYSLGAPVILSTAPIPFTKAVLLAPALAFPSFIGLVRLFSWLPDVVIPSASPSRVRARRGTPVREYVALQQAADVFWKEKWPVQKQMPTQIYIDSSDELVSAGNLKNMLEKGFGTHSWKLNFIERDKVVSRDSPHHLIVDEPSLGPVAFAQLVANMAAHFRS